MVRRLSIISFFLLLFAFPDRLSAQYTITAYPPVGNNVALEHLWHFMIAGQVDPVYSQFYVSIRVFNDQNNLIIKSNSSTFDIPLLPMYVNYTDVSLISPINTALYDNFYNDVVNAGGFFPPGTYHVIMTLYGRPTDGEFIELSQSEYDFIIEALYPPTLIFPCGEISPTQYPNFTWTPAFISSNSSIEYCLKLVEVYNGQTPYQAIMSNPSYYEECNIPVTLLNYPPNTNSIEPDQLYAWQVWATINDVPVVYSNICDFIYHLPDSAEPEIRIKPYAYVSEEVDGGFYYAVKNKLRFIYSIEEYVPEIGDSLQFKIYDNITGSVIKQSGDNVVFGPTVVKYGENRYIFELGGCGLNLTTEKYYTLEVTNLKNRKKYLVFYNPVVEPNTICGDEQN